MKILQIELSADEQTAIFNELTKRFNTEDTSQKIEFDLFDVRHSYNLSVDDINDYDSSVFSEDYGVNCESTLELYTEYPEPDENNQTAISSRSVVKFRITFFHDGEGIDVKDWYIEDRIL